MNDNELNDLLKILIDNTKDEQELEYLKGLLNYNNETIDLDTFNNIADYESSKVLKKE